MIAAYSRLAVPYARFPTVVSAEPLCLAQKLCVGPKEPLVHGRLQLQVEVGLTGHRLPQDMR